MTSIDAVARKGNDFYFGRFVRHSRSSQSHMGFFKFSHTSRDEAQDVADDQGLTGDIFLFDGYRTQLLLPAVKEQLQ